MAALIEVIEDPDDRRLPPLARDALLSLVVQLRATQERIAELEKELTAWHRSSEASQRPTAIPGVGVITATALVATIGDATQFRSARQFAAWLGQVPRQQSSGGKDRLGRISKRGDGYLRRLLVHGARTVPFWSRRRKETRSNWLENLLARRPTNVALAALANKTARIVWAMLCRNEPFQPDRQAAA
ncbi:MAG: IS110 family transposase [Kiloniellaceae bacterium]